MGPKHTYPGCMNWLFKAHSLWWDTLLTCDTEVLGEEGLILPQPGMSDFVDSSRGVLSTLRSGWRVVCGQVGCRKRGGRGADVGMKNEKS